MTYFWTNRKVVWITKILQVPSPGSRSPEISGFHARDSGIQKWSRVPGPEISGFHFGPESATLEFGQ